MMADNKQDDDFYAEFNRWLSDKGFKYFLINQPAFWVVLTLLVVFVALATGALLATGQSEIVVDFLQALTP